MSALPVPLSEFWSLPGREARKVIDLDAIAANAAILKKSLSPGTLLMAVVKANAYGHGDVAVAGTALAHGADYLAVATLEEGMRLRRSEIVAPILCLGPLNVAEMVVASRNRIQISIGSRESLEALQGLLETQANGCVQIQVKINTGMNRYGLQPNEVGDAFSLLDGLPNVVVRGTWTHFARSDEPGEEPLQNQIDLFQQLLASIRVAGFDPGLVHVSNSGGLLRSREYDFDMVRAGICLYGVAPSRDIPLPARMRPAMTIRCRSQRISTLEAGTEVGYGGTWRTDELAQIALLPLGYADGLPRSLSNRGAFVSNGIKHQIAGRVSMDQTVVVAPAGVDIASKQEFSLLGADDGINLDATSLADLIGTIPYEVLTSFDLRIPAYYLEDHHIVAYDNTLFASS